MALFCASTTITLGDGKRCLFWHDSWCQGWPLKEQFPSLYTIGTRKHRTVAVELEGAKWIRALQNITTAGQLESFVQMWHRLLGVQLLPQADRITWKWTPSTTYTAASAYRCQFLGGHPPSTPTKYGGPRLSRSANSLHGWWHTRKSARLMSWRCGDGHTTPFASFAASTLRRCSTSVMITPSRRRFGMRC